MVLSCLITVPSIWVIGLVPVCRTVFYRIGLELVTWATLCSFRFEILIDRVLMLISSLVSIEVSIRGARDASVMVVLRLIGDTAIAIVLYVWVRLLIAVICLGLSLGNGAMI